MVITVYLMFHYGLLDVFLQRTYNRFIGTNDRLHRQSLGVISYTINGAESSTRAFGRTSSTATSTFGRSTNNSVFGVERDLESPQRRTLFGWR